MIDTNTNGVLGKVQEIFKLAMGTDVDVDLNTEKDMIAEWDSLNHLNLVVELENSFDLGLSMEEIEKMNSVKGIVELISSRKK